MNIEEIYRICEKNGRRPLMVGSGNSAVVAVLGMEGRLFYGRGGQAVSLFRREAAEKVSTSRSGYFNPGGDGLWPAPEGTKFGYEYPTGKWRVPMSLVTAQYEVVSKSSDSFEISAEIDLINNQQLGLPCRFTRKAQVKERADGATVIEQSDAIEYIGGCELSPEVFRLAPWSLSQFTVNGSSLARFGDPGTPVRDLYESSADLLSRQGDAITMTHDAKRRIQLALPGKSGFVQLIMPDRKLKVSRYSAPPEEGLHPIDIADASPDDDPSAPVRFSIYNDPSGFMELEVAGGSTDVLTPGTMLGMQATNVIETMED